LKWAVLAAGRNFGDCIKRSLAGAGSHIAIDVKVSNISARKIQKEYKYAFEA